MDIDMKKNFQVSILCAVAIIFFLGLFVSSPMGMMKNEDESQNDSIFNDLEPFFEAISIVRSEYIQKDIDIKKLIQGAIRGMLSELDDPYSRYLDPIAFQREKENMFIGHFDGLGIIITIVEEQLTVISPIEDTPAYQAGIKAGDDIIEIDGELTKGMSLDEAVNILRGEKGTVVSLKIQRGESKELLDINITRDTIIVEAVKDKILESGQVGYIRISTFNANTGPELREVLDRFTNLSLEGIIVDLRNNPGGLLESSIDVASQFVKQGAIVKITGRNNITKVYDSQGNDYPEWPLVVMVNNGSASASEIVAGAVQDADRGVILGESTFGKGLVQQVYSLSDDSGVTISTSEYYTPKGRVINHIGIEPDITIPVPLDDKGESEEDIQLEEAIDLLLQNKVLTVLEADEE